MTVNDMKIACMKIACMKSFVKPFMKIVCRQRVPEIIFSKNRCVIYFFILDIHFFFSLFRQRRQFFYLI